MLELCFSDSVKGALKCAQHCGDGSCEVSLILSENGSASEEEWEAALRRARTQAEERRRNAVPLGGDARDVLALPLALSVGDISQPLSDQCPQRALIRRWCTENLGDEDWDRQHWRDCMNDLARLKGRGAETIRVWVDQTPDSLCGLLFAAEALAESNGPVVLMSLPPWRERPDGTVVQYMGWGEVCPEEFGRFLDCAIPLSPRLLGMLAHRWQELREENAPLRAVVNGRVVSVDEDFYDVHIRRHLKDGEWKIGAVIGEVLGRCRLGIGDHWIADRLRVMLREGVLQMVREEPHFYRCVVKMGDKF